MTKRQQCFYCHGLVAGNGVGDHFPIPKNCGGTETVPCCSSCHDMKDRFALDNWPAEWMSMILQDFPRMSRETRLFFAKSIRYVVEAVDIVKKHKASADEIERLRAERDEARRMVCGLDADTTEDQIEYAKHHGWDCYKEGT
jgi:hypothetical protein